MSAVVTHNPQASRFEVRFEAPFESSADAAASGQLAVCSYRRDGTLLVLHHTEVPAALQGQGIAAALVAAALAWAREQGLRVRPSCSYVAAYMRRHPETLDLLQGR